LTFNFITGKGLRNEGEEVLYFPVDALLPPKVTQYLELEGKLAGKDKNRVKTIKLRGMISQGVISDFGIIEEMEGEKTSETITNFLGIEKYEPEPIMSTAGNLLPLPEGASKYDIEGCERHTEALEQLKTGPVCITEKLEGTNFSVMINEEELFVNQRGFTIQEIEGKGNTYWNAARDCGIISFAQWLVQNKKTVLVYGELCGPNIQKNLYKLKKHQVFVFDIKMDNKWISKLEMFDYIETYNNRIDVKNKIVHVPIIEKQCMLNNFLNGKSIKEASTASSLLGIKLREGIVINPIKEQMCYELSGRLILKQRSPEYLAKYDT